MDQKGQALQSDTKMTPQQKQQQWASDVKDGDDQIMAIFTPTQKADYLKMTQLREKLAREAQAAQAQK
jgi:hypothetical protein